jgi:hypothetical protein
MRTRTRTRAIQASHLLSISQLMGLKKCLIINKSTLKS